MGRKKKQQPTPRKTPTFTNNPFRDIGKKLKSASASDAAATAGSSNSTLENEDPDVAREESEVGRNAESEEDAVLRAMMADASPIEHKRANLPHVVKEPPSAMDDSELVMRKLDEIVHGRSDFDIADTDEYIEASVMGLDRRIVKKLRKGEYALQGHLDLHGMNREEARDKVATFVNQSHKKGKRCILIVHGRGLGSKDQIPVLKEKLRAWLTRGAMGKKVLAYTSARPYDGGTGAVYVLLRA